MSKLAQIWRTVLLAVAFALAALLGSQFATSAQAWQGGQALGRQVETADRHLAMRQGDPDHDGLRTWFELARSRTNWHRADTDHDGLKDGVEVHSTKTDPRRADTDGDGFGDGVEVAAGSNPRLATSVPAHPAAPGSTEPAAPTPPTPTPPTPDPPSSQPTVVPNTSIDSGPSGVVTTTSATFSFSADEADASFKCRLDSAAWSACGSPKSYSLLATGAHTFSVRAANSAGADPTPPVTGWTIQAPSPPAASSCVEGATSVTTATALINAVEAKKSACVTANVGDVAISDMGDRTGVVISTEGGSIGEIEIENTVGLIVSSARLRSVTIRSSNRTVIEDSTIGGTASNRVSDQLIFMPDQSNDVIIRDNDIGWTTADNSGNTGYGCRCYGKTDRLQFVGNIVHDIAADGFQGTNGSDILIDRNKIGPVGANPGSSEHSDNIQMVSNGPGLKITNNWIYEQGYFEGQVTGNSGSIYVHGGTTNSMLIENNLVQIARGRTEICGLGTGGTSRSNITIRHNTWIEGGQTFTSFPGFEWDCDSGSGNSVEGNISVDPDGGFAQDGSSAAAVFTDNLWGTLSLVTFDANGNCSSTNCNPPGREPIGYRKPSGVRW